MDTRIERQIARFERETGLSFDDFLNGNVKYVPNHDTDEDEKELQQLYEPLQRQVIEQED
jgi:hypothetical protein